MYVYMVGLLEDLHRLDDGMPPRPLAPVKRSSKIEQPYIKLCNHQRNYASASLDATSNGYGNLNIISTPDSLKSNGDEDDDDHDSETDGSYSDEKNSGKLNMTALLVPDLAPSGLKMMPRAGTDPVDNNDDSGDDNDENGGNITSINTDNEIDDVEVAIERERLQRERREELLFIHNNNTTQEDHDELRRASNEAGRTLKDHHDVLTHLATDADDGENIDSFSSSWSFDRSPVAEVIMKGEHESNKGGVVRQMNVRSKLKVKQRQQEINNNN